MRKCKFFGTVVAAVCLLGLATGAFAVEFLNIGTGSTGGTYYPAGAAMAKVCNSSIEGIQVSVQSTGGTVNNIQLLADSEAELGFMDGLYYYAYMGKGRYEGDPQKYIRALIPLYPEPIQLMAAKGSGINSVEDLRGKRVSIGAVASGTEVTAKQLLRLAGIDPEKDIKPENLGVGDTGRAFGDKRIDAAIMVGSLGMAGVVEATTLGLVNFIDIPDELIALVVEETPYWVPFEIPAGYYKDQPDPVKTYASWNIVAIKDSVNDDLVYQMTKAIFENKDDILAVSARLESMTPENVRHILIPLHPGAEKYYREVGAIK
jgi:hypothetical protein